MKRFVCEQTTITLWSGVEWSESVCNIKNQQKDESVLE